MSGITKTIKTVLQFILLTMMSTPEEIKDDHESVLALGDSGPSSSVALVLWNDEVHSFAEVTTILSLTLEITDVQAGYFAELVDEQVSNSNFRVVLRYTQWIGRILILNIFIESRLKSAELV